ncbi:MAG: YigZ family protein [Ruminococcus sp.]|nr:YigZ family protein [Ruminococcus sp.]
MDAPDYRTISGKAKESFTERKSEFIGYITHAETDEEAVGFINSVRAEHRKATHVVYAYILRNGNITRYSDDGEPQGTAGVPVFEVLRKEGLTDVCCAVVRYFGGILLGGGGLVRAYSKSAKTAVDAAEIKIMCSCYPIEITADYSLYGRLLTVFPEFEAKVTDTVFSDGVKISLLCKTDKADELEKKLTDIANGKIIMQKGEKSFENFA